jgi:hypothetical protein
VWQHYVSYLFHDGLVSLVQIFFWLTMQLVRLHSQEIAQQGFRERGHGFSSRLLKKDWPKIRKLKALNDTGWRYFEHLVKAMHKRLGEEKTYEVLIDFMMGNVDRNFKRGMKVFGITGNDAWSLASYFKLASGDVLGYKTELQRLSPTKVAYKLYPPCLRFPNLDIPPSFCEAMVCFEVVAAKMINPKIKVTHGKLMTAGDECCEIFFKETD